MKKIKQRYVIRENDTKNVALQNINRVKQVISACNNNNTLTLYERNIVVEIAVLNTLLEQDTKGELAIPLTVEKCLSIVLRLDDLLHTGIIAMENERSLRSNS